MFLVYNDNCFFKKHLIISILQYHELWLFLTKFHHFYIVYEMIGPQTMIT